MSLEQTLWAGWITGSMGDRIGCLKTHKGTLDLGANLLSFKLMTSVQK